VKGQFMLIASIFAGVIVISAASTISEVQGRSVSTAEISNTAENLKYEAERIFAGQNELSQQERENYRQMVSFISDYRTEADYWERGSESCFNITLKSPEVESDLRCIN